MGVDKDLLRLLLQLIHAKEVPEEPFAGLGPMPKPPLESAWRTPAGAPFTPPRAPAGEVSGRVTPSDVMVG